MANDRVMKILVYLSLMFGVLSSVLHLVYSLVCKSCIVVKPNSALSHVKL